MSPYSPLTLRSCASDGVTVIAARGEIDLATAPQLRDEIIRHLAPGGELHLRLDAVTFIDASGLRVLLASQRRAALLDACLVLVSTSRVVDRLMELTGTAGLLDRSRSVRRSTGDLDELLEVHTGQLQARARAGRGSPTRSGPYTARASASATRERRAT